MTFVVTAPVAPSPASGQQNVESLIEAYVGQVLPDVTGTGATSAGQVKVNIAGEDVDVSVWVTASSGAYTTANKFAWIPAHEGVYTLTVTDVTATTVVTSKIRVFQS
jgi:hypothetical protein